MSFSQSLQVKAILLSEGSENGMKEIRRFRVEVEGNEMSGRQLMPSLLSHVRTVFNVDSSSQQYALFWKDEDDDLIQFSSEEELRHAMDNMADDTLRIYVTVTERAREEEKAEEKASHSHQGSAFHPPPPPHHHPHPSGPPPPPFQFHGPWAHWGWKKWKPMNVGGWKGGWKGGLFYGCPWTMGRQGYGCGWKNRGFFKHGWDKKMKKAMGKNWKMMAKGQHEFVEVRQQVPAAFRDWVRQYVRAFYLQGPEAAQTGTKDRLPEGVGQDFSQWLPSFLQRRHPHPQARQNQDGEENKEGEAEQAPDCLPPLYYRWLCLFLPRFFWRNPQLGCSSTASGEEGEGTQPMRDHWHGFRQEFCGKRGFGWPGKHGHCKRHKGGKHKGGKCHSSSDSDSDSGQKAWQKVPKGLRKFVRMSFKQLRNGKAYNPKIKEKATRAGVSQEVQDFVEQVMLEWNAKRSSQPCGAIAKEMMEGERTLPAGLQREHFLWMIRFMGRWDGERCGFLRGWMGGDSSTDDTSGEEAVPDGPGYGQCPPYPPGMGPMPGTAPFMEPPFVPPPPPMYGCFPPPPPPPMCRPPAYMFSCGGMGQGYGDGSAPMNEKAQDGKGCMDHCSDSDSSSSSAYDMVEKVTEGVKKM